MMRMRTIGSFLRKTLIDIPASSMYCGSMLAKDMVAASAKPLLLSILAEGESYGYEIIQKVRELSGGEIEWSDGMLYPVLHRMERDGLIESEWKEAETGRQRKYYFISVEGHKMLQNERHQWLAVHNTLARLWNIKPVTT
jgi:PadR family transcriptional regulator PadR